MSGAREFIDTIRTELKPLHHKIINHRYVGALENANVSRESLAAFAIQQYHIIASDLRSIALLLARHGNLPSRPYLLGILQGENGPRGADQICADVGNQSRSATRLGTASSGVRL